MRGIDAVFLGGKLVEFGIHPRTLRGLLGVLLAPFIHAGWRHLIANTFPFLILGWLVLLRGVRPFVQVTVATALVSGLGVWAIGAPSTTHVGVSGVVFGYFGFLLGRAYYERSLVSLLVGLVVIMLYGSLIWSVFPLQQDVSWEGHLFGGLAGVVCARVLADSRYRPRKR